MSLRGSRSKSKQKQFDHKVAYPRLIKSLWHVSAGTRRGRARSIVGPARKYLQRRSALKKEGSEPAPAILIGGGVRFSFPPPALRERGHCTKRSYFIEC